MEPEEPSEPAALILDYGNVLSCLQPADDIKSMARLAGCPAHALEAAYWLHRKTYDEGLTSLEYWGAVLADASPHQSPDQALLEQLSELDLVSWTHYRDELWDLVLAYRKAGGRTAMLTNNIPTLMARIDRDRPLATWFDVVTVSYEVGVLKPDPRMYRVCLSALGVEAPDALFVDDRPENVLAAEGLGLQALLFDERNGMGRLREHLQDWLPTHS